MLNAVMYEVNKDYTAQYKSWGAQLMGSRHAEAIKSLETEGVERESTFFVESDGKSYLIFVTESKNKPKEADMTMPVNQEHRSQNREILKRETRADAQLIYDLESNQ